MKTSKSPGPTKVASMTDYRMNLANHGGPTGGGPTVDAHTKDYVDAKTDATRAQNDARFAEVIEKLNATNPMTWQQCAAVVATGLGILLAILAFGGDRFDGGMSQGQEVATQTAEAKALAERNEQSIQTLTETVSETNKNVGELVDLIKSEQDPN